jgi:putative transposase
MTVFVTFRLADSLPLHVVERYLRERKRLDRRLAANPGDPQLRRHATMLYARRIDRCLDSGIGSCHLRSPEVARRTLDALRFFDGDRYTLLSSVVMPNHVHVLVMLRPDVEFKKVTHSWKSDLSQVARRDPSAPRPYWQHKTYDHIVRDEVELVRLNRYIMENPTKAGLKGWPWVFSRVSVDENRELRLDTP